MRFTTRIIIVLLLEVLTLAACRGEETPIPTPSLTPTRTLIPSVTLPPPTPTDTAYPTDTPTSRPPTNTLSATITQTWPQTPTRTPTVTPTFTPTNVPTPTNTVTQGTPGTPTLTPTFTNTPVSTLTPTPQLSPTSTPDRSDDPLLWINPSILTLSSNGGQGNALLYLSNITETYSIDVELSYNPSVLTVIDYDPNVQGIQVQPGNCPQPQTIVLNSVNTTLGIINYTVSQVGSTAGCNGGIVFSVLFQCVAGGQSPLDIDDSLILNRATEELAHYLNAGTIICP